MKHSKWSRKVVHHSHPWTTECTTPLPPPPRLESPHFWMAHGHSLLSSSYHSRLPVRAFLWMGRKALWHTVRNRPPVPHADVESFWTVPLQGDTSSVGGMRSYGERVCYLYSAHHTTHVVFSHSHGERGGSSSRRWSGAADTLPPAPVALDQREWGALDVRHVPWRSCGIIRVGCVVLPPKT